MIVGSLKQKKGVSAVLQQWNFLQRIYSTELIRRDWYKERQVLWKQKK